MLIWFYSKTILKLIIKTLYHIFFPVIRNPELSFVYYYAYKDVTLDFVKLIDYLRSAPRSDRHGQSNLRALKCKKRAT